MSVRPKDLRDDAPQVEALYCGECLMHYPADPSAYDWMFDTDSIVCEGCGSELVPTEPLSLRG